MNFLMLLTLSTVIIIVLIIKPDSSSTLGILHTNLASINKYHDDLSTILTLLKPEIHVIGISGQWMKVSRNFLNSEILKKEQIKFYSLRHLNNNPTIMDRFPVATPVYLL